MARNQRSVGFIYAILGMVTYGLVPVFGHYFVREIDPILFGGMASIMGALPLVLYLAVRRKQQDLTALKFRRPLMGIAALGVCSTFCMFVGTELTSGLNTGLLLQLEPLYSMLLSILFLGEVVGRGEAAATATMVLGAGVIVYNKGDRLNAGDLLILTTPLFQQLSHVITKRIIHKVSDTMVIPSARLLYSGIVLTSAALAARPSVCLQSALPRNWLAFLAFGVVFRGLDCFLWYQAIKRIPLSRASAVIPVSVAVSFAGSLLFLRESAGAKHYLGLLLIFGGLAWLSYRHLKENRQGLAEEPLP